MDYLGASNVSQIFLREGGGRVRVRKGDVIVEGETRVI